MSMSIGERVRTARLLKHMSQKALGLACGYSEASATPVIQHIEHDRRLPSIMILRPLSRALEISIDALVPPDLDLNWKPDGRRKALQCNAKESG